MKIVDIAIPTKIVTGLVVMAAVAVGGVMWGASTARMVSERAQSVISGESMAATLLARANQQVFRAGDIAYRGISRTEPAEIRDFFGRYDGSFAEFRDLAREAGQALPRRSGEIEAYVAEFEKVVAIARRAGRLAEAGRRAAAQEVLLDEFEGGVDRLKNSIAKTIAVMTEEATAAARAADDDAETAILENEIGVVGAALGLLAAIVWLAIGGISRPLRRLGERMTSLAAGDADTAVSGAERGDEVGMMARAVEVFRREALEKRRIEAEAIAAEARSRETRRRDLHELADRLEQSVSGLVDLVAAAATELQATAATLTASAEETTNQSLAVSSASEEASVNVKSVAAAAEELSRTVREVGRRVGESAGIAAKAVDEARVTNQRVAELSETVEKIGTIVGLIDDIASQTNLLALNATIEAARAGEAGRGFAVVAAEVKGLAEQTARATAEIGARIEKVQVETRQASAEIVEIGRTIVTMNEISAGIASDVEEEGATTDAIAASIVQAASGTAEVSGNIVGVSRAAEEVSAAATQVLGAAGDLARHCEQMRAEIGQFVGGIRAA